MAATLPIALEAPFQADAELARRHAVGDPAAFEEIYARYSGLVFNLCWRLATDREDALDLAQEVFLRLHRHVGRFRGGSTLRTWVYRVTLNHCRSRFARRRPATEPLPEPAEGGRELAASGPDPEQIAAGAELEHRLETALGELPLAFREAVVLRDVEGLGYDEIAEVLGVPVGTVRSRIFRGREAIDKRIEMMKV